MFQCERFLPDCGCGAAALCRSPLRGVLPTVLDYSRQMHRLIRLIAERSPEFRHINADRVLVSLTPARNNSSYGLHGKLVPLRFERGRPRKKVQGTTYSMPRIEIGGHKMLYIIYFCLPRFQDQTFDDKLSTVFHEMYHISPEFDGDLRRFDGRNAIHGSSSKRYEEKMTAFAEDYIKRYPDCPAHAFLTVDFEELVRRYGEVVGLRIREPQPIPVT